MRPIPVAQREKRTMVIWAQNTGQTAAFLTFEIAKVTYNVPAGWWIGIDGETGDATVTQFHEESV
jgi:hypothetical protein